MSVDRLIALKTTPPPVGAADAERLAHALYGLVVGATPLLGERDRNFRLSTDDGCDYVLKVIDPMADAPSVECQSLVFAHLLEQDLGLPVPRIIPTLENAPVGYGKVGGETYRVRLMKLMPGEMAGSRAADGALLGAIGQMIARLDRALRGFFHPALAQSIVWDVRQAPALLAYTDYLVSPASRRLVRAALEPLANHRSALRALGAQAIHGDCNPRNVLVNDARDTCAAILDFGDMIHAPLVLEPAVAMAEFLAEGTASRELVAEILAGFCSVQPLEVADIEVLYELVNARLASSVLIHAWRTRHDPAGSEEVAEWVALAAESLRALTAIGRTALTREWHRIAGTSGASTISGTPAERSACEAELFTKRRRLLGANAELFYARPVHLVRGSGVWVYAADGQRFLDVYNNVPHVGHAHPAVVNAVRAQASRIASNTRYLDETVLEYAERLTATMPEGLDACLFVNSGSEANDVAWQIAQSHTGRAGALVMAHSYHGMTEATTKLSSSLRHTVPSHVECLAAPPSSKDIAGSRAEESSPLGVRDAERCLAALKRRGFGLAAFICDSAFASNGVYDPPRSWMVPIVTAVRDAGGLMIADEVQFGLGRSGTHFWGFARRGYIPDIVTLGKPIGNGFPLGVVITRREILEAFQATSGFFSTFGGNPVAAAAGLAVLDVLERERLVMNAEMTGSHLRERLEQLAARNEALGDVRGSGFLLGLDVIDAAGAPAPRRARFIVNNMRERCVLIGFGGPHDHVLKLRPPMPFSREQADHVANTLADVLTSVAFVGEA